MRRLRGRDELDSLPLSHHFASVALDGLAGIGGDERGGVGIRAVQKHLDAGRAAALHVASKAGEHAHHAVYLAAIQQFLHLGFADGSCCDDEAARTFEFRKQLAALRRAVLVHPSDARGVDVQVHREPVNEQLNQGRQEQHGARARVTQSLYEFLPDHSPQPLPHDDFLLMPPSAVTCGLRNRIFRLRRRPATGSRTTTALAQLLSERFLSPC